jgi:hypothetical protein
MSFFPVELRIIIMHSRETFALLLRGLGRCVPVRLYGSAVAGGAQPHGNGSNAREE